MVHKGKKRYARKYLGDKVEEGIARLLLSRLWWKGLICCGFFSLTYPCITFTPMPSSMIVVARTTQSPAACDMLALAA